MRRRIVAAAASGLAVVGIGLLLWGSVAGSNPAHAPDGPATRIWVAGRDVSAGADSESAMADAVQRSMPVAAVPPGALTAPPASDSVTTRPLFAGQPLTVRDFGDHPASPLPLAAGQVAVSVDLPDPARVGGFLRPGSEVRVFRVTGASQAGVVLERVPVIATGSVTAASGPGPSPEGSGDQQAAARGSSPPSVITLAVTAAEAKLILAAAARGEIALGLLPDLRAAGVTA